MILSRKGFDSKNGGIASPILPDGTLLSLPIPQENGRAYGELRHNGETYKNIIEQLGGKCGDGGCHLDPDIRQGVFEAPSEWKPAFGQTGIPQKTLVNQGVGVGDLFLFFGWFKQTEHGSDGKLRFVPKSPDLHVIYGYLQVGAVLTEKSEIQAYNWHPHAGNENESNCLYIPSDNLSWDGSKQGHGVFSFDKRLVLTKEGMSRSCWQLPEIPKLPVSSGGDRLKISGALKDAWRTDSQHGEYYRIADIGQEFVIEEHPAVEEWAKALING